MPIQEIGKFSSRTVSCTSTLTQSKVKELAEIEYKVFSHTERQWNNKRIFTLIITVYDANIAFIKESVNSALQQCYSDVEIILISHGTSGEVRLYLDSVFAATNKSKLIIVDDHIYPAPKGNPSHRVSLLWNAGLFASEGDLVYFLSWDDYLDTDYVTRMVRLFEDDSECVCGSPRVVSIDADSNINLERTRYLDSHNQRDRYEDSKTLCLDYIRGGSMVTFPGGYLCQLTGRVLERGGFDPQNDYTQLLRFAVGGKVGFDSSVNLYWRHHSNQANKLLVRYGFIYYRYLLDFYLNHEIYDLHEQIYGQEFAQECRQYFYRLAEDEVYAQIASCIEMYPLSLLRMNFNIFRQCDKKILMKSLFIQLKYVLFSLPLSSLIGILKLVRRIVMTSGRRRT